MAKKNPVLHIDFETRSAADLKMTGVEKYAEDPSTGIWCMSYQFEGDAHPKTWHPRDPFPPKVMTHVRLGRTVVAHNAAFEIAIWNRVLPRYFKGEKHDPGYLAPEQCDCTMARAAAFALPLSLAAVADALDADVKKDMEGRRLMLRMARPRKTTEDGEHIWWDVPERVDRLMEYCEDDVRAEIEIDGFLPALSAREKRVWAMDQLINERGVQLDIEAIHAANQIMKEYKEELNNELTSLTDGRVRSAQNVTALRSWLRAEGLDVPDLTKERLARLLKRKLPDKIHRALRIRAEVGRNSTAKLEAMLASACADGRARGLYQYHAATTGRWGGRRVQPQNLFRPLIEPEDVRLAIEKMVEGGRPGIIKGTKELSLSEIVASCLRGMFIAAEGKILVAADFSQIEARVLPWLARDKNKLEIFASGRDIYKHTAAQIYDVDDEDDVTPEQRFVGKVGELALGYQGGSAAFQRMANLYGVDVPHDKAEEIKHRWRAANPKTVELWKSMEQAAIAVVKNPDKRYRYRAGRLTFYMRGEEHLAMRLPSGRDLIYPFAEVKPEPGPFGMKETLSFYGQDTYTRQWGRTSTYGGKLTENATQAVARDVQAEAMGRCEVGGFPVVMHVHDEIVTEICTGSGDKHPEKRLVSIMTQSPNWAEELPIAAEGWSGQRYRK